MINHSEQAVNNHVQKVLAWRESMTVMSDNLFFELMRMYLGEIKTPYNKQKLIEELSSFLRKDENKRNLIKLLSDTDLQIINAVYFIPEATQEKLNAFFPSIFSFAALYERLLNLQERLIIFSHLDKTGTKQIIEVNPLLEESLKPFLNLSNLLPKAEYAERTDMQQPGLTPLLIASFLSFIASNPDVCKTDGSFKKRALISLEKIFSENMEILNYLIKACINLSLVKEQEKGFFIDFNRCKAFAALDEYTQYAYLCVAACGRFSREGFNKQAQLLLNAAASILPEGYSESIVIRSGILILAAKPSEDAISASRFSRMIENSRTVKENQAGTNDKTVNPLERLLEPAAAFGIFSVQGKTASGERIFTAGARFTANAIPQNENNADTLRINAGFSITIMPGLSLARLLPLIKFMDIEQFDSVATFEITRKSVFRALDDGLTAKTIFAELKKNTPFDLPQNLTVSIDEWDHSYSSATLYSGFILKVDSTNKMLTAQNPLLSPHIKKTLSDGIFLLDVKNADEAQELIKKCGIDFIGRVKTVEDAPPQVSFPNLAKGRPMFSQDLVADKTDSSEKTFSRGTEEDRASFLVKLRAELTGMNLDAEQKEGLDLRIRRKIILTSEQLRSDSVRLEKTEASGMDFIGKIRIVERALSTGCMIEIGMNQKLIPGVHDVVPPRILGMPLSIEKYGNDTTVRLRIEPEQIEKIFSIGQADFVKRIRGSIIQEVSEKN